jgi:hypothetical protein
MLQRAIAGGWKLGNQTHMQHGSTAAPVLCLHWC